MLSSHSKNQEPQLIHSNAPIYLDYAAATPLDERVLEKMETYLKGCYANPSGLHGFAQRSRAAVDEARAVIAKILHCLPDEIFFTGGGTEANNWALFGTANATPKKHLITTVLEHHSVLYPARELERRGYKVTFLIPNNEGFINMAELEREITDETFLVSIMYGQNEIGTIEDIEHIGKLLTNKKILFHSDACQASGYLPLNPHEIGLDLMTINGGKIYGPKGVGVLYIKKGTPITPFLYGGGQEHRLRAGTENVAAIVGFAEAFKIAENIRAAESDRLTRLRDAWMEELLMTFPGSHVNGSRDRRLPHNINITFPGIDGESLLIRLDMEGVCAASGSACASGSLEPSHVLLGISLSPALAKSSIRFTLGRHTTQEQLKTVTQILKRYVTIPS